MDSKTETMVDILRNLPYCKWDSDHPHGADVYISDGWARSIANELEQLQQQIDKWTETQTEQCLMCEKLDVVKLRYERDSYKNLLESHGPEGHNYTNEQAGTFRRERDEARQQVEEIQSNYHDIYAGNIELSNKLGQLQAQVGMMREALEINRDMENSKIITKGHCKQCNSVITALHNGICGMCLVDNALSITPAEVQQKVQMLISALEKARSWHRTPDEKPSKDKQHMLWDGKSYISDDVAKEIDKALAEFRGAR